MAPSSAWRVGMVGLWMLAACPAHASTTTAGYVTFVTLEQNGTANFYQSGTRTTPPACATDPRWTLDTSTSAGQARLSALLTAYVSGKQITIQGTGTCSTGYPAIESINYFTVQN